MKMEFLISLVLLACVVSTSAWGVCLDEARDFGNCDSVYLEKWRADTSFTGGGPYSVRVPIYLTHEVYDTVIITISGDPPDTSYGYDSIAGLQIPVCFTHNNPSKYCSLSTYWNLTTVSTTSTRSIFRHLVDGTDTTYNWMLRQKVLGDEVEEDWVWSNILLNLYSQPDSAHFWLLLVPTTQPVIANESKRLIATMTFRIQDTMTVCIDTCLWPPSSILSFSRTNGEVWVPRMGTPHNPTSNEVCLHFAPSPSDVREIQGSDEVRPSQFYLSQNYPNPFNPITNFQFTLAKSVHVRIEIFNIVGQKVRTLVDKDMKPGVYQADWEGKDESGNAVSSGIYFYKMQAGEFSNMKKMVLLK